MANGGSLDELEVIQDEHILEDVEEENGPPKAALGLDNAAGFLPMP
jgi:hypothetical protein